MTSHDHTGPLDSHDEQHHDEPPPPDEPRTPAWLTVVGVSLFVVAGMWFLATRPNAKTIEELRAAHAAASTSASAAAAPSTPPEAASAVVRPNLQVIRPPAPGQPGRMP